MTERAMTDVEIELALVEEGYQVRRSPHDEALTWHLDHGPYVHVTVDVYWDEIEQTQAKVVSRLQRAHLPVPEALA